MFQVVVWRYAVRGFVVGTIFFELYSYFVVMEGEHDVSFTRFHFVDDKFEI